MSDNHINTNQAWLNWISLERPAKVKQANPAAVV